MERRWKDGRGKLSNDTLVYFCLPCCNWAPHSFRQSTSLTARRSSTTRCRWWTGCSTSSTSSRSSTFRTNWNSTGKRDSSVEFRRTAARRSASGRARAVSTRRWTPKVRPSFGTTTGSTTRPCWSCWTGSATPFQTGSKTNWRTPGIRVELWTDFLRRDHVPGSVFSRWPTSLARIVVQTLPLVCSFVFALIYFRFDRCPANNQLAIKPNLVQIKNAKVPHW